MNHQTSPNPTQTDPSNMLLSSLPVLQSSLLPSSYPPATWRLLITAPLDGATNMAIDEAILHALADGHGTPTLRFFQWGPPCLSLGYNQHWREVDEAACQRLGYTWTRRPTGGKAILHTDEVTYSLIIPQDDPRIQGGIVESYRLLSLGLLRGLEKLGVQATQATGDDGAADTRAARGGPVCFDTPSRYEITWQGKKLIGSAQLRRRKIVLQHGTLPLTGDLNRILEALTFTPEEREVQAELLPRRATTLEQVTGRALAYEQVMAALIEGFAEELNLTLPEMPLTEQEQALADKLRAEQYAHDSWNKRV
ncbi:MAG: lipoate--protein ligase family protein [Anaerolineales bacterium]|nr:lipoate--protein ligase family protein [Anaerolineales bacterium]